MKEHPILFSGPMVKALLDGKKTQTRRIIKEQPPSTVRGRPWCSVEDMINECPYGHVGDRLWVRETWANVDQGDGTSVVEYRADTGNKYPGHWPEDMGDDSECGRWKPSIHMPRKASRITLEIVDIRVERLKQISEDDAEAEGAIIGHYYSGSYREPKTYKQAFSDLWNSINEKRGFSWRKNPWVWAVQFKMIKCPHCDKPECDGVTYESVSEVQHRMAEEQDAETPADAGQEEDPDYGNDRDADFHAFLKEQAEDDEGDAERARELEREDGE